MLTALKELWSKYDLNGDEVKKMADENKWAHARVHIMSVCLSHSSWHYSSSSPLPSSATTTKHIVAAPVCVSGPRSRWTNWDHRRHSSSGLSLRSIILPCNIILSLQSNPSSARPSGPTLRANPFLIHATKVLGDGWCEPQSRLFLILGHVWHWWWQSHHIHRVYSSDSSQVALLLNPSFAGIDFTRCIVWFTILTWAQIPISLHLDVPRMKDKTKRTHRQNTKKRQNLLQKRCVSRPNISFWMSVWDLHLPIPSMQAKKKWEKNKTRETA